MNEELKEIPNIINVDDIQEIIETNKYLLEENEQLKKQKEELKEWIKENNYGFNLSSNAALNKVLDKINELEGEDK